MTDRYYSLVESRVYDDACVYGNAWVFGNVWVFDDARVYGTAWVSGTARVYDDDHVLTVGPVGPNRVSVTLYRTQTGHGLHVGCWTGTLDTLAAEVEDRAQHWPGNKTRQAAWRAQYVALGALGRATIATWDEVAA